MKTIERLNPDVLLETIGIENYRIDYEALVVYLPENEFKKLAVYFSKHSTAVEFEEGGWRWVKSDG